MIGTIDIKLQAENPQLPLSPFYAFVNSPSQVRVLNVPRRIGSWAITKVYVTANFPDNASRSVECTCTGGCWHGTLAGSTATGTSTNGFCVTADGVSEDGTTSVTGYVLGKGDLAILAADSTITVGETTYYVHHVSSQPTSPKRGDLCVIDNVWKIYTGSAWSALGSTASISWSDVTDKPSSFTPSAHASTHATGGADAITPAAIGASVVSVSSTGTATDEVNYITIDGTEKKLAGGGSGEPSEYLKTASVASQKLTITKKDDTTVELDVSGKATKVAGATAGHFASLTADGELADSNYGPTAFEATGTAEGAVATHNTSASAHGTLFAAKQDTISDLSTIRSGAAAGATAVQSFAAVGGQTPSVTSGVADLSSLFGSGNTLNNAANVNYTYGGATTTVQAEIVALKQQLGNIETALNRILGGN